LPERFRTFDSLLSEIARSPVGDTNAMPKGVRFIFSLDGDLLSKLDDLVDGASYVCSSVNEFRKINYTGITGGTWNTKAKNVESDSKLGKFK
jgi:Doublecortin